MSGAVSLLFFLSGFIGLLYEVLWAKYLGIALGSTAVAQTFVLAMFMGGLALGNARLGPKADASRDPLSLYGRLELGVALLGLASPFLLRLAGLPASLLPQAALSALVILPPTFLMGGTLPALSRLATRRLSDLQGAVAKFYFLNSLGAVLGALSAGFYLIPTFGLDASLGIAAAANLAVAGAALWIARGGEAPGTAPRGKGAKGLPSEDERMEDSGPLGVVLGVIFISGWVSLSYEIAWTRLLALVLGSSSYSFSLMLAAFISGIALGSLLIAKGWHPRRGAYELLGWAELGLALSILATLPFYDKLSWLALILDRTIPRTPGNFYLYESIQLLMCFLLMLPPTTFLGMTLPLASRSATRSAERVGSGVGLVFSLNTLGNVLGAASSGLCLLPLLGLEGLIQAGVALNLLAGCAVLWTSLRWSFRRKAAFSLACLLFWGAQSAWAPPWDKRLLSNGVFRLSFLWRDLPTFSLYNFRKAAHRNSLVFYQDDRDATVAVFQNKGNFWLNVNGKTDASTGIDMKTQVLGAQLPLFLNPHAKDVLVIGLGSGTTAGSVLRHPIQRLDVAEISRAVVAGSHFFDQVNGDPLKDPRTHLAVEDGKAFLKRSPQRYDVIISEPSNPWIAGIGNLFSVDYYQDALGHLRPGGIVAQWFHLYENDDDTLRLLLRTFCSVFGHVTVWQTKAYPIELSK